VNFLGISIGFGEGELIDLSELLTYCLLLDLTCMLFNPPIKLLFNCSKLRASIVTSNPLKYFQLWQIFFDKIIDYASDIAVLNQLQNRFVTE
jgi:hypothetical protein